MTETKIVGYASPELFIKSRRAKWIVKGKSEEFTGLQFGVGGAPVRLARPRDKKNTVRYKIRVEMKFGDEGKFFDVEGFHHLDLVKEASSAIMIGDCKKRSKLEAKSKKGLAEYVITITSEKK